MSATPRPEPDIDWCYDAVEDVSRTFALTVEALAEPMASHIGLGYLLCRIPDTIEDAGHLPPTAKATLLGTYDAALDPQDDITMRDFQREAGDWLPPAAERNADWTVVEQAPTVWATFDEHSGAVRESVIPPVREMVAGMKTFVQRYADSGGLRIETVAELEDYCYYAAGTVGTLITNLLTEDELSEERTRILNDSATNFGLLLQLVNISKDVYADFTEENNVYLPAEWLAERGVDQSAVLATENQAAVADVVRRTATHAETFLDDAQSYIEAMPLTRGNTLEAWSVPFFLSVATIRELKARPEDALTEAGVKISRDEVLAIMAAAQDQDRDEISTLREQIARGPYHETAR